MQDVFPGVVTGPLTSSSISATTPFETRTVMGVTNRETIAFEDRFRALAPEHVEAWYEVIFWKLASTGRLGESRAVRMIKDLKEFGPVAAKMWSACTNFVATGSRKSFEELQRELFITSKGIPVAATFAAFISPERFPMADRWIAKWVLRYIRAHSPASAVNDLVAASEPFLVGRKTTLTTSGDWAFYERWIEWCRAAADVLRETSGFSWRARDVGMAAFQNERSASPLLPRIDLG